MRWPCAKEVSESQLRGHERGRDGQRESEEVKRARQMKTGDLERAI